MTHITVTQNTVTRSVTSRWHNHLLKIEYKYTLRLLLQLQLPINLQKKSNLCRLHLPLLPKKKSTKTTNLPISDLLIISMAVNLPIIAVNIPEPLELASPMIGHPWHPAKDVALLLDVRYSVPGLLELLGKCSNQANYLDTQVCNLKRLRATFSVAHYLLIRLFSIPDSGQTPHNLDAEEHQKYINIGNDSFREFTRLLKIAENHALVGPVPIWDETLYGLFVEKLKSSKFMEGLRKGVDQKFNLVVAQRLKEVMDEEDRDNLDRDLMELELDGLNISFGEHRWMEVV